MASSDSVGFSEELHFGVPDDDAFFASMHDSHGFQHLGGADLNDFIAVYESEAEFIAKLSVSHEESRRVLDSWKDDYLDWTENYNDEIGPFHFADPGVASTATALSLVGALPIQTCVGARGHDEEFPQVLFWGAKDAVLQAKTVAEESGLDFDCVYEGSEEKNDPAQFMVSTKAAASQMRDFALALAIRFARSNAPDRLEELEMLRSTAGEFEIPAWLLRESE
jgi:hypothetical protein